MRAELQRDIYQLRSVLARIRDLLNTPPTSELGDPNVEAAWRLAVEYAEEGNHEVMEMVRGLPMGEAAEAVSQAMMRDKTAIRWKSRTGYMNADYNAIGEIAVAVLIASGWGPRATAARSDTTESSPPPR